MELDPTHGHRPVYTSEYECVCQFCQKDGKVCEAKRRGQEHAQEVGMLLIHSSEMLCLVVGEERKKIYCHKLLLAFYSEYFDGALNIGMVESQTREFMMPDDDAAAMDIFVAWIYTGHIIEGKTVGVELWVLGDRLLSPWFSNEVMHLFFALYSNDLTDARDVNYVVNNTTEKSELRLFMMELLINEAAISNLQHLKPEYLRAPCLADQGDSSAFEKSLNDWMVFLNGGGPFVLELLIRGFQKNVEDEDQAYHWSNQHKFLEPITTRPIEDFLEDRTRSRIQ